MERNINSGIITRAVLFVIAFVVAALCLCATPAYAAESGTWGTCNWELDDEGILTIHEGFGVNTNGQSPWEECEHMVKKVVIDGTVVLPEISANLFGHASECTSIEGLTYFNTSNVTDMSGMFECHDSLTTLDLTSFDTSRVTNMNRMFGVCANLATIEGLENFDTSNVTDMSDMFSGCGELATLNLSSWDTSRVINMARMFEWCKSLTSLYLSNLDTSKVTDMSGMFGVCRSLTSLNLSSFDTSSVTSAEAMFSYCESLKTIYVSDKWDVSNVVEAYCMFRDCFALTGCNGFLYNEYCTDAMFAVVDDPEAGTPGYLTYKEPGTYTFNYPIQVDVMYSTEDGEVWDQNQFTYNYGSDESVGIVTIYFADLQENINNIIPDGYKIKHITYLDSNSGEPRIVTAEDTIDYVLCMPFLLEATIEVAPAVEEPEDNNVTAAFNFHFKATGIQATGFNDYKEAFAALNN